MSQDEVTIAHEISHACMGILSGQLLHGLDPVSVDQVRSVLRSAIKMISEARRERDAQLDKIIHMVHTLPCSNPIDPGWIRLDILNALLDMRMNHDQPGGTGR